MPKNLFHTQTNAFGLEIGNKSIKVLELKKSGNNYKLIGRKRETLPENAVVNNEIQNEEAVIATIKKAVNSAKPKSIKSKNVVISLPENKTFVKSIQLPKLEKDKEEKIISAEIEKYIPLSLDDVYYDWQVIKSTKDTVNIFLAAAPKKIVDSYQSTLIKTGLRPIVFDLEAAAEARALISAKFSANRAALIVDIGETKTLLIISENSDIPFTTNLEDISGNVFTKTVAKNLNITVHEAEKKKIRCCSPRMTEDEQKTLEAMHNVLDDLAYEIKKILDYYEDRFLRHQNIIEIFLCGGGAGTTGIEKYLALKLKKKVKLGNPWINIPLLRHELDLTESLIFTKTIGLAIRGISL